MVPWCQVPPAHCLPFPPELMSGLHYGSEEIWLLVAGQFVSTNRVIRASDDRTVRSGRSPAYSLR